MAAPPSQQDSSPQPITSPGRATWLERPPALALLVLTAIAFAPSLLAGFVYDDIMLIQNNPFVHGVAYLGRAFTSGFWDTFATGAGGDRSYFRPLITASSCVDWALGGGSPVVFHLVNLLAHLAATWLALRVAIRWTGSPLAGAVAALLFAIHPTRTEAVTWVAGRTDVFMTLFLLLAVQAFWRGSQAPTRAARAGWAATGLVSGVAALLCKEPAVVLPLLVAADLVLRPPGRRRYLAGCVAATSILAVAYLVLRAVLLPVQDGAMYWDLPYGLMTVGAYLRRLLYPFPHSMFTDPLLLVDGQLRYSLALMVAGGLFLSTCLAFAVWGLRRDRAALLLLGAGGLVIAPLLNFLQPTLINTAADRFLYLPLLLLACAASRPLVARPSLQGKPARLAPNPLPSPDPRQTTSDRGRQCQCYPHC